MSINEILEDLYMLDPALKSEEAELKKIIEKLMNAKPEAEPDEEFKLRLKTELLDVMKQKKRRKGFFLIHRRAVVGVSAGLAAALVLVLTFAIRPAMSGMTETSVPLMGEISELASDQHQMRPEAPVVAEVQADEAPADAYAGREVSSSQMMKRSLSLEDESQIAYSMDMEKSTVGPGFGNEEEFNTEEYSRIYENDFVAVMEEPLSTFSVDVDTASYSNVRRFLNSGVLPPPDAVRIEELMNYFSYDYSQPEGAVPFSFDAELSECPWNRSHNLLHVGLQGWDLAPGEIPQSNLVFLIDVSGSMSDENKLPLLKKSMALLSDSLRQEDRVSIVAYAGAAGLVLPPTAGNRKAEILAALDNLEAGGSTAGGEGIALAYKVAAENLFKDGNNRVLIATDGDFNVGQSSEGELTRMIEARRDQGIYLTVLGMGMDNFKDSKMESLADNGNGNYAYIDTLNEARKVLVNEMSSTLFTIAKDVKIQIEFNPAEVESYRLIGYENRVMAAQDFDDDKKDAGEIGAGHSVTALYEIIPAEGAVGTADLRYQSRTASETAEDSGELAYIKFRYKKPDEDQSNLVEYPIAASYIEPESVSENFRFSAAVAEWGLLLRNSEYKADADIENVIKAVRGALGSDEYGYRAEFLSMLYKVRDLLPRN